MSLAKELSTGYLTHVVLDVRVRNRVSINDALKGREVLELTREELEHMYDVAVACDKKGGRGITPRDDNAIIREIMTGSTDECMGGTSSIVTYFPVGGALFDTVADVEREMDILERTEERTYAKEKGNA